MEISFYSETIHGNKVTVTRLDTYLDDEQITVVGEAVRHPEDKDDKELAALLSNARALDSLARKLDRRAQGLVKMNDHNKEYKKRQKEKTKEKELSTEEHVQTKRNKRWQGGSRKKKSFGTT